MTRSSSCADVNCPCLVPAVSRRDDGVFPAPVYCRLANGRVRVPSRDELATLCTADHYHECSGHRRWAASLAWAGAGTGPAGGPS
jgi:hypothetical protein